MYIIKSKQKVKRNVSARNLIGTQTLIFKIKSD